MQDESGRLGQAAGPARTSGPPQPNTGTTTRRERWARLRRFAVVIGSLHHELHGHDDARARSTFLVQILADRSQPRRITRIV
jgi:hypothetical protein